MKYAIRIFVLLALVFVVSCSRKDSVETTSSTEVPKSAADAAQPAEPAAGPRVVINLQNGSKVPGTIVASTKTDMVLAGEDGIERKIPLGQIKSVDYGSPATEPTRQSRAVVPTRPSSPAKEERAAAETKPVIPPSQPPVERTPEPAAVQPRVTTKTYELPAGSQISVRTNEPIDSTTAAEGQTFDAQVTRDARDANGDVVIPRGASAGIVIRSASKGGRIRGASDLVLDLQSVAIRGQRYTLDTLDVTRRGKSGIGANRRTAEYTGGGAALGAIIGAIAGGGKGAAIGAGAGAGAGALTQVLTKGKSIKVPVESVLTFSLDKPLKVVEAE
jgi:hypothetical protein